MSCTGGAIQPDSRVTFTCLLLDLSLRVTFVKERSLGRRIVSDYMAVQSA